MSKDRIVRCNICASNIPNTKLICDWATEVEDVGFICTNCAVNMLGYKCIDCNFLDKVRCDFDL